MSGLQKSMAALLKTHGCTVNVSASHVGGRSRAAKGAQQGGTAHSDGTASIQRRKTQICHHHACLQIAGGCKFSSVQAASLQAFLGSAQPSLTA